MSACTAITAATIAGLLRKRLPAVDGQLANADLAPSSPLTDDVRLLGGQVVDLSGQR